MQATKTIVEFCQKIFSGNQLEIKGNKKVIFRIGYPHQKLDYSAKPYITIDMEEDGKDRKREPVDPKQLLEFLTERWGILGRYKKHLEEERLGLTATSAYNKGYCHVLEHVIKDLHHIMYANIDPNKLYGSKN